MASQIAGADETVSSLYSVKSEQATMLSFDTYNYLVHYFGQPQGSMADDPKVVAAILPLYMDGLYLSRYSDNKEAPTLSD